MLTVDNSHLAKKIALRELSENYFLLVIVRDADTYAATFHQVHSVALITRVKQWRVGLYGTRLQQVAQIA